MSEEMNLLDLTGRVALVSGAGQGVGAKTAEYLAAHGASVIVNDYVLERAEAVAGEISGRGGTSLHPAGIPPRWSSQIRYSAEQRRKPESQGW